MRERLKNMPVPVVATMLGAATLSNVYQSLGFDWVRHLSMWASTLVLLFYIAKIIIHPSAVKAEYSNTVPASLYAGITMVTMILCSYYKVWFLQMDFHNSCVCSRSTYPGFPVPQRI